MSNEAECRRQEQLRRELVRLSRLLARLGYAPGTSGNLSVRLDGERLLVTPTGVSKSLVKAADMVIVDLSGRVLAGTRNVTSEVGMHLAVYEARADVDAVVHAHPATATAFACSGRGLEEMLCQEAVMSLGSVPLARYATTGTAEVAESMVPYFAKHDAILLANHGAVTYGTTLLDAFMKMETMEHVAQVALIAHQLGTARPLLPAQIAQLQGAKARYQRKATFQPDACSAFAE